MKYKQIKELPFSPVGSIWEIAGETIKVDGENYTFCFPENHKSLVMYYTDDYGNLNMEGEWFEIAGTEDEKKLEIIRQKRKVEEEISYYEAAIEDAKIRKFNIN